MSDAPFNDNKFEKMSNKKVKLQSIHDLFEFDAQVKQSKCLVSGCTVSVKGKNSSHLKRHAKVKHPIEYAVYLMETNMEKEGQPLNLLKKEGMKLRSHDETAITKMEQKKKRNQINCKAYRERIKLKKQTEDKLKNPSIYEPKSLIVDPTAQLLPDTNVDVPVSEIPKNVFTSKRNTSTSRLVLIHPTTSQSDPVPVMSKQRGTRIAEIEENHHVPISKDGTVSLSLNKPQGQQLDGIDPNPFFLDTRIKSVCPKGPTLGIVEISSNKVENTGISSLVDNLSGGTTNKEIFNSSITPQPSASILLKAMSDIMVLLEPNPSGVSNIPSESIEDVPLLIPILDSFQEASFPADYASIETYPQPYSTTSTIENYPLQSSTQVVLSPEATIMLREQMQKHVQLLTQMYLITAQQSDLKSVTEGCHCMLQNLVPLKQRIEIANLDEALDLVTHWETVVTKSSPEELRKYQRPVVNYGEKKKFLKRSRKNLERFPFNPKMVELMAASRAFIYPELLPTLAIFQAEQGPCKMSPHEDQLIAMGIERFTPFYIDYFSGSQEPIAHLICSMISQFMLPHWTAKQIETRIITKCLPTSAANPIKYYLENKVAPSVHHVIQPFDRYSTHKLADIPPLLLPERWRELFGYKNTMVISRYRFPEQNVNRVTSSSSSCESHIMKNALINFEIDQKKLAASTSKRPKSPNKCDSILEKTQVSTANTTRQHRNNTNTKRRRLVHRHEVEIDLEEVFIENIKSEIEEWKHF